MAIIGSEVQDYLGRTPKPINEERLKQATKINMLGNVFNLLSQGVMGDRGATINPIKDIVTPYVLNRFNEQRQMDFRQGEADRQLTIRQLIRDQEITAKNIREDAIRQEGITRKGTERQEDIDIRAEENKKRPTIDQQKEIAAITSGQKLEDYGKMKNIDYNHQVRVATAMEKIKKETGGKKPYYKPVNMIKNKYPVNDIEVSSLRANVIDLVRSDPAIFEKLKKYNPEYARNVMRSQQDLKPDDWENITDFLFDDLKANYLDLHDELMKIYQGDVSQPVKDKATPKVKIDW